MESVKTTAKSKRVIKRSLEKIGFEGIHFQSWNQVRELLDTTDLSEISILSDLSFGAWKGHWVASELQMQLDISVDGAVQPMLNEGNYADIVGRLIDNESEGDRNFLFALESCIQICDAIENKGIDYILIIPPHAGNDWEEENLQLMYLLFHALKESEVTVILLCSPGSVIPENWEISYRNEPAPIEMEPVIPPFPGIVDLETLPLLKNQPGDFALLRNNRVVLNPLKRGECWEDTPEAAWRKTSHIAALFELRTRQKPNRELIEQEAMLRFKEGAYGIALKLLNALLLKAENNLEREEIRSQIQNIRIALMDFESAATEQDPPDDLPDSYIASLSLSKAWGLVMINQPELAEKYFEKARKFLKESEFPRLYLYLLNISALNKLRNGDMETAFAFEKRIEQTLAEQEERDWHITYVNYINQARLFKKIGDYKTSEHYYQLAFGINYQLKNESDLLYTNFCFAQLVELEEKNNEALVYWLRTCIHWLSNPLPEMLAPRVAQAILAKRLSNKRGEVEELSAKLYESLSRICSKNDLEVDESSRLNYTRPGTTSAIPELAAGKPGWGMLLSTADSDRIYDGDQYDQLNALVTGCLQALLPAVQWKNYRTVMTDTLFGSELPQTSSELLLLSLRFGVNKINFDNHFYELKNEDLTNLSFKIKASVSPAIRFVVPCQDGTVWVYFKRYLPPVLLDKEETALLKLVERSGKELTEHRVALKKIEKLAEKRIVQFYL